MKIVTKNFLNKKFVKNEKNKNVKLISGSLLGSVAIYFFKIFKPITQILRFVLEIKIVYNKVYKFTSVY